ncbi:undecaprenyldiphospho-muramoylpentapeptide beta-N-acetylglucosaminyltransferase [Deinococcus peraridilitoris DSM 19664]|uniref:UDP-N-acetylglucosamine--N-acetylmuramyl-(pentapeptide) pyrophosphoryl-undecaprenol N-acetylglucosamine transferase n=1 Tax=Deinococcus peraridilitoris (strain DSM 19664 / LMG 22246 / CIP 109416 / KR-200) TaxID=937777 RepID=K9ZYG7_DEIPD|nr:undecaprenyldiphospho-muramoylpentapeptide beta-N-acetylglucosaminyltransferase [Deinococcus peraridilitoris DSM 19664]
MVLAAGGTGGHIYPAIATAQELRQRGYHPVLLGQRGGMEERIAADSRLEFVGVSAGKFARTRPDPRELWRAARGFWEARRYLAGTRPVCVVGYGGFASLPGVMSGQSLGIPTVLHEQNARLGLTQRLALRRAHTVATAYPEVKGLPTGRGTLVGMPVREERMERADALRELGLQDGPLTIYVTGGSQGSQALNDAVPSVLRHLFGDEGLWHSGSVQVMHSTGLRWVREVSGRVHGIEWYKTSGFVNAVAAWSAADLAITRAGTGTLAEAAFHGVPLIMVPLPTSAENHQFYNARSVEEGGAGRLVEQKDLHQNLGRVVHECLDHDTRNAMRARAAARSPQGAAQLLADAVEQALRGRARKHRSSPAGS